MAFPINLEEEGDLVQQLLTDYVKTATPDDTYRLVGLDLLHRLAWHRGADVDDFPPQPTREELAATVVHGKDRAYETRTGHTFKGEM